MAGVGSYPDQRAAMEAAQSNLGIGEKIKIVKVGKGETLTGRGCKFTNRHMKSRQVIITYVEISSARFFIRDIYPINPSGGNRSVKHPTQQSPARH